MSEPSNEVDPLTIGDLVRVESLTDSMNESMKTTLGTRLGRIFTEQNPASPPVTALTKEFAITFTQDLFLSVVRELARNTAQDVINIEAPKAASVFPAFDASDVCDEGELAAHEQHLDGGGKTSEAFARDLICSLRRARLETERAWAKRRLYYSERQVAKREEALEAKYQRQIVALRGVLDRYTEALGRATTLLGEVDYYSMMQTASRADVLSVERDGVGVESLVLEAAVKMIDAVDLPEGKRCPRCHHAAPNDQGCAACNPVRLGVLLLEANQKIAELETKLGAVTLDRDALANYNRPSPGEQKLDDLIDRARSRKEF